MMGNIIAFNPCGTCSRENMCSMCELQMRRSGSIQSNKWISVDERLPTVEEQSRGLVGIINGFNGKIRFENARVFLNYDYNFNEWYSQDYDIQNCKIECWMPLPEAPKGGADNEKQIEEA